MLSRNMKIAYAGLVLMFASLVGLLAGIPTAIFGVYSEMRSSNVRKPTPAEGGSG